MKSACQPNGLGCDVRAFPAMQATETMLSMTRDRHRGTSEGIRGNDKPARLAGSQTQRVVKA
jgi:hypothetical protein